MLVLFTKQLLVGSINNDKKEQRLTKKVVIVFIFKSYYFNIVPLCCYCRLERLGFGATMKYI